MTHDSVFPQVELRYDGESGTDQVWKRTLSDCMKRNPSWEADSYLASQIHRFLWYRKVRYRVICSRPEPDESLSRCHTMFGLLSVLVAFEKLRKAIVGFVMSVCPSVRVELGFHRTDFIGIWYLSIFFRKCVEKIQV